MKKLAAVIAALFILVASAQTSTTGNIAADPYNWVNAGSVNQGLPCWQPGDPMCHPQPYVNGTSINFSYGLTDIYQIHNVANVLPYSGTGLVVTGYHFQYTAKVGNYWDDARYDYLKSYVRIYGTGGQLIQSGDFTHTNTHDWYTFNLADSYNPLLTRFTKDNYTQVRFGFVGQDYNGWVGPYGPEITNISFTLNYQPDPCLRSQLVSPQCPGFLDAIQKASALPKQQEYIVENAVETTAVKQSLAQEKKIEQAQATKNKAKEEIKLAAKEQEQVTEITNMDLKTTTASTSIEQVRTIQQTKQQTKTNSQTVVETMDNQNQIVEYSVNTSSKQSQETQQTSTTLPTIGGSMTANVDTNNSVILPTEPQKQQQEPEVINTQVISMRLPEMTAPVIPQIEIPQPPQMEQTKPQVDLVQAQPNIMYTPPVQNQVQQTPTTELIQVVEPPVLTKVEPQTQEVASSLPSNMFTDKTNPINSIVTAQPQIPTIAAFTGPTVNQKQQDNDIAGGVSIARMAVVPAGFDAYNVALKDVAFYAPREIYRNQRTVDNARALRQLGSDRLHQQMVDQQYRR